MSDIFARNVPGTTKILHSACIGIAGCGGLGSNAAVALIRAGVGRLILADCDVVEESNLNRQYYFQSDIGRRKVDVLAEHLLAINPDVQLESHHIELNPENVPQIFADADLLIEAFDEADKKKWLIESWCAAYPHKHIVCGNGLSGFGRTEDLRITRCGKIHFCGDCRTDMSIGLCSARVAIVANMQANVAIEILVNRGAK